MKAMLRIAALCAAALFATGAFAHSASDAYLTLTAESGASSRIVHAQWDIALRDLDFVLALDADGDGNVTWGELRARQSDIARYVYPSLRAGSTAGACTIKPSAQKVVDHADGAYAVLQFDIGCPANSTTMTLDYQLFFAIDPSHRGIVVMRNGDRVATSLLAPDHASVRLDF